jgi:hypothetical protein
MREDGSVTSWRDKYEDIELIIIDDRWAELASPLPNQAPQRKVSASQSVASDCRLALDVAATKEIRCRLENVPSA